MSATSRRARQMTESIQAEDGQSSQPRTAAWAVVCVSVILLCLSSRAGQKGDFAPWGDFIINLFQN
jgi:hypothetical protein